jgi:hypothetical protein
MSAAAGSDRQSLTGRCNCGAVTFAAAGPFRPAKACHCKTCRRQSGHFLAATQIDKVDLHVTGEATLTWYAASEKAVRGFCKVCGAHLFWQTHRSERVSILMGCLDEPTGHRTGRPHFCLRKGRLLSYRGWLAAGLGRVSQSRATGEPTFRHCKSGTGVK